MLIDTVRRTIEEHALLRQGDHVVLGLSGGPDSLCLFHVLKRLAPEYDLTIHPVHVNHRLRPEAAEQDQAWVEAFCAGEGMPCRSFVVDCNALAAERGMTGEEAGRTARYDAFCRVAEEVAAGSEGEAGSEVAAGPRASVRIAVGQNANDQAETILHRLLRGTGTDGLAGMAYSRLERGFPVIRPLLDVTREEIEEYCRQQGLEPLIDHTNLEPVYTRNRIRLEILPTLAAVNGNIVETLVRLGRIAAADSDYLWRAAEEAYGQVLLEAEPEGHEGPADPAAPECHEGPAAPAAPVSICMDRERLAAQPDAIRRRILLKAFGQIGLESDISEERLRAADEIIGKKQGPKTVEFPRGYRLTVRRGRVIFMR